MKGTSTRLRSAAGVQLWHRAQRPLQDLQLWRALAQRLLDVTATLPDLPSIHTFLPQIEVTTVLPGWLTRGATSQACHFSHSATAHGLSFRGSCGLPAPNALKDDGPSSRGTPQGPPK